MYAAARVFTGWNLRLVNRGADAAENYYEFVYIPNNHDTTAKTFTFPIYRNGVADDSGACGGGGHAGRHRLHHGAGHASGDGARLARKLWNFFVSEAFDPIPTSCAARPASTCRTTRG